MTCVECRAISSQFAPSYRHSGRYEATWNGVSAYVLCGEDRRASVQMGVVPNSNSSSSHRASSATIDVLCVPGRTGHESVCANDWPSSTKVHLFRVCQSMPPSRVFINEGLLLYRTTTPKTTKKSSTINQPARVVNDSRMCPDQHSSTHMQSHSCHGLMSDEKQRLGCHRYRTSRQPGRSPSASWCTYGACGGLRRVLLPVKSVEITSKQPPIFVSSPHVSVFKFISPKGKHNN